MPPPKMRNVNYHGLLLDQGEIEALQEQPISEILRFETRGDSTVMQAKLPETGLYVPPEGAQDDGPAGKEYGIRVNMNYLVKGMVRAVMDKDGNIDADKLAELKDQTEKFFTGKIKPRDRDKKVGEFMDTLGIPEDQRADFKLFLKANGVPDGKTPQLVNPMSGPVGMMLQEVTADLLPYQKAVSGELGPEAKAYAQKYQHYYENTLRGYREMADMDPKKETRILYPTDCASFSEQMESFVKQNNAFRAANGLEPVNVTRRTLNFAPQEQENEEGQKLGFASHSYLTADITLPDSYGLGKEPVTLTIENTAPATGELLHRPEVSRTGLGIYRNAQELEDYHRDRNLKNVPDFDTFQKIKYAKIAGRDEPYPKLTMPPKASYNRYYELHTGSAAADIPDEKLTEYAAKATAALFFRSETDKKFDVSVPRKYAKALMKNANFKAAIKATGKDRLRDILVSGDPAALAKMVAGDYDKRYSVDDKTRTAFAEMAASMDPKGRSDKFKALKAALGDPNMKNSSQVFDAVEGYLKGRKSTRRSPQEKETVELCLKALSMAAASGDQVAEERAQILVDRINEVRGAEPGSKDHVDLDNYREKEQVIDLDLPILKDEDVLLDDPYAEMRQDGSAAKERPLPQQQGGGSQLKIPLVKPIEYEDVLLDGP